MSEVSRATHLEEVADLLWPQPRRWAVRRSPTPAGNGSVQSFLVIPSARNPRLLVAADAGVGRAAVNNMHNGSKPRDWLRAAALARVLGTAAGRRLLRDRLEVYDREPTSEPDGSLQARLDEITGTETYWAMPVSRARANRKPVLQLLDRNGHAVAFVKIGTNELTRKLVRAEAGALRELPHRLSEVHVPEVIASTTWQSLDLLVLSPLPLASARSKPPRAQLESAARELAEIAGVRREPLVECSYWKRLGVRLRSAADPRSRELSRVWESLTDRWARASLAIGSWHGDWAPWNMAWNGDRLLVWDFERFEGDVPLGLDLVHFDLQTRILGPKAQPDEVITERRRNSPALLRAFDLGEQESRRVFTVYLLEIASRWITDRQDEAGASANLLDAMVRAARGVESYERRV